MRPVFGHDPNERPKPALAFFDLAHSVVRFALVNCLGFNESFFEFVGIGVEGVYNSLKPPIVTAVLQPSFRKLPSMLRCPKRSEELGTAQPGRADAAYATGLGFPASTAPSPGRLAALNAHSCASLERKLK